MLCAAIAISVLRLLALAKSSVQIIAAAAPQEGGQHCSRVRGLKIIGEFITSSSVTSLLKIANGFLAACLLALTLIFAKVFADVPYSLICSSPAPPKN